MFGRGGRELFRGDKDYAYQSWVLWGPRIRRISMNF